jgi:putative ABC transport system permease protein
MTVRSVRAWLLRLAGLFTASRRDADFDRELESHLQLHVDDNLRAGMTPDEARRQAWIALGGVERTRDAYRDRRGVPVVESLARDLRYGGRVLLKSPGFALAAMLILGLGIGSNTAIFSVVNAVVLRPLPFPESSRIMRVWHTPPANQFSGMPIFSVSPANYIDWRDQNHVFDRMTIYRFRRANLTGRGEPDALDGRAVSAEFFDVLGVQPLLGRTLRPGDDQEGSANVVILSEKIWRSRFGADPGIVSRSVALDGDPHTVVGVIPQRLAFPEDAQFWVPLVWTAKDRAVRGNHNHSVIAKLKPGVDVQRAQAEMTTISKRLEQQYPADDKGWGALVRPLHQDLVGDVRRPLLVLLGAVAFVLLIACANLANLLLARTLGRSREIAVRTALGASRGRVVQQLLAESVLLGIAGGAVGLVAASLSINAIVGSIGQELPRAGEIALDARVLAFTGAIAVLTGLLAGVAPAWRLTKGDVGEALKQGVGRGSSQAGEHAVRQVLVVAEVALALTLLVGAGLLIRSLWQLRAVDPGIDPRRVLTMTVVIPRTKYPEPQQQARFFDRTLERVRAVPGVEAASAVDSLPLQGGSTQPVAIEGQPVLPLSEQPEVAVRSITPGYLATVRLPLVAGRDFTEADTADRTAAVIVSETMARRFWPGRNPIGQHLTLGLMSDAPREVVGIVRDVKLLGLDVRDPVAAVYTAAAQTPSFYMSLAVRTTVPPATVTQAIVNAIHAIDPEQPVVDILTMDEVIGASLTQQRFAMLLLTAFAALALVLAAVGISSVLSYSVRQRVREIGIRMALGAPAGGVLRLIVVEGMKPTLIGLAIGLAAAAALGRVLSTLIFGITARDATTFAAVSTIVIAVGLVASLVPAYRATRVDPLQALRSE